MQFGIFTICLVCELLQLVLGVFMTGGYVPTRINTESLRGAGPRVNGHALLNRRRPRKHHNANIGSRYLRRRPGRRQLDRTSLLSLLGEDYEPSFMTADRPKRKFISVPSEEVNVDRLPGRWSKEELLRQMNRINLTAELQSVDPELVPLEHKIREWMLRRSTCPIEFSWKDLGKQYWPRWVREGLCLNRESYCSFPTGMNCVPGAWTTVHVLNWQCEDHNNEATILKRSVVVDDSDREISVLYKKRVPPIPTKTALKKPKKKCEWVKVPFPITIDCFCTC